MKSVIWLSDDSSFYSPKTPEELVRLVEEAAFLRVRVNRDETDSRRVWIRTSQITTIRYA